MAARLNLLIEQGTTYRAEMKLTDKNGNPVDLTGHVFTGHVRKTISSPTVEFTLQFNIPVQTGEDVGRVEIFVLSGTTTALSLPAQNTITRTLVKYCYDVESVGGGDTTRWLEGEVHISPEVTR